jgi:hypothetical protein
MRELGTDARSALDAMNFASPLAGFSEYLINILLFPLEKIVSKISKLLKMSSNSSAPSSNKNATAVAAAAAKKVVLAMFAREQILDQQAAEHLLWLWQGSSFCSQPFAGVDFSTIDMLQKG